MAVRRVRERRIVVPDHWAAKRSHQTLAVRRPVQEEVAHDFKPIPWIRRELTPEMGREGDPVRKMSPRRPHPLRNRIEQPMSPSQAERSKTTTPDTDWKQLAGWVERSDAPAIEAYLKQLSETDRVHDLGRLTADARSELLGLVHPEYAADLIEEMPKLLAAEAFEDLTPDNAAEILEELASDDQANLLRHIEPKSAKAILDHTPSLAADSVRGLLEYSEDTAGGRMITEYLAVPATRSVQDVIDEMRANVEEYADYAVQYVYAVDQAGALAGVVPLRELLLARPNRSIASCMVNTPVKVRADAHITEVFELFDEYDYIAVPVVSEDKTLVGALLREDVDALRLDEAHEQERNARGIVGGEELRSMPTAVRSSRRLAWLSINIVLNVTAASVIALYEETLQAVIALAVFLPIISDMSGCSGNQSVAVSLRELSLGLIRPKEYRRVIAKESIVGLINGVVLGSILGVLAWLWKDNVALGLVVGSALALNTVIAVCIGGSVPLLVRRLGYDPALASGPMLTTVTDVCGFFLTLSIATAALSHLIA